MDVKNDPISKEEELRVFAQKENDYILYVLFNPDSKPSREDPEALAVRNCASTESCFGANDPLHAMALNTLGYVRLFKKSAVETVEPLIIQALNLLQDREDQPEMLLESKLLQIYARISGGIHAAEAIIHVFNENEAESKPAVASNLLTGILISAVFEKKLNRIIAILSLNYVATRFYQELEQSKVKIPDTFLLNYQAFNNIYLNQ